MRKDLISLSKGERSTDWRSVKGVVSKSVGSLSMVSRKRILEGLGSVHFLGIPSL